MPPSLQQQQHSQTPSSIQFAYARFCLLAGHQSPLSVSRPSRVADFGTGLIVHAREPRPTAETPPRRNSGERGTLPGAAHRLFLCRKQAKKETKP